MNAVAPGVRHPQVSALCSLLQPLCGSTRNAVLRNDATASSGHYVETCARLPAESRITSRRRRQGDIDGGGEHCSSSFSARAWRRVHMPFRSALKLGSYSGIMNRRNCKAILLEKRMHYPVNHGRSAMKRRSGDAAFEYWA